LVFVPRIAEIPAYLAAVKAIKPDLGPVRLATAFTPRTQTAWRRWRPSAKGSWTCLLTTTILERGVTFKHVWVIIIAADDAIYPPASLVQIAGRVGRR
jgi:competence protein ComFA